MTLKTILAFVAAISLAAMPVLAVNPPEYDPSPTISITGPTNVCFGNSASFTCFNNEWAGWTNPVSYTWIVDGATNSCNSNTLNFTWNTAGTKVVTVIHDSNAIDGRGASITNYNGQAASLAVTVVEVTSVSVSPNVIAVGGGPNIVYTTTTNPSGHTNMVTVTPVDDSMPGSNLVVAVCGSSTATCNVTVIKVEIAMDGNRDDSIDFDNPDDAKYLFWVNDDYDVAHWEEDMWHEDDDPSPDGASMSRNCDDDYIGETEGSGALINPHNCRRDLEDFTRLHIRVNDNTANMSGITYWLKFENTGGTAPSVNIFEAIDESLSYLQNGTVADQQIQKTRLLTVDATERQLPNAYIKTGNQRSPFILEGKTAGKGDLTIIVKNDGHQVCKKVVTLELRPITKFYQVFRVATVGQNSTDVSAGYNSDFTSSDDYLLIVHGFNMNATDKTYWPGTAFKRLWWQGYKGHVGFFDWPCVLFSYLNMRCYDDSENNAWQCGSALLNRINQLNSGGHSGKVRVLAHSQGNVVAGEALRLASGQVVHTYIATQPAIAGDCYQTGLAAYFTTYTTPNVFANYPLNGAPYLAGVSGKAGQRYDYYNFDDYALRTVGFGSWEWDNETRPDGDFAYVEGDNNVDTYNPTQGDRFYSEETALDFPGDKFQIFSYAAEARSRALGVLSGLTGDFTPFNLQSAPLNYNSAHYSHSRQFRSNIVDERAYWSHVKSNCGF